MRHNRHKGNRDKNKTSLPQVPKAQISNSESDEYEFAKELSDQYELVAKPGFGPTEVKRKDEK
ncbi:YfhD family protein [Bacillus sp. NEB1478]|uniref:YfhD family protein n=1 Tax=Bacillus sp. NEB1478 TaxID=3073816 RepID=UPI0028731759|nr:YfhD family protein [Bacillus sp. NEB1478]WNB92929.1 YfhD family protein [Bacillus sp. NEB1478]